jgi:hypothetical protein
MKYFVGLVALVATLALLVGPAQAQLLPGTNEGGFDDWGSFFAADEQTGPVGADPLSVLYWDANSSMVVNAPSVDTTYDRTVLKIQSLVTPVGSGNSPYYSGTPEIVGLIYDLVVSDVRFVNVASNGLQTVVANDGNNAIHRIDIDLSNAARWDAEGYTGGRTDFWVEPSLAGAVPLDMASNPPANWTESADPTAGVDFAVTSWFAAGNHDDFPTATDGIALPFLTGTLVAENPGDALLTLSLWVQDDPTVGGNAAAGTGFSSFGFIDILDDTQARLLGGSPIAQDVYFDTAEIKFQNTFTFWPDDTIPYEPTFDDPTSDPIWWDTKSDDPAFFQVIPEPTSMTLLGLGLAGLIARRRRRK